MRRLIHFVREAVANIRLNRTTTIIAVATTAFTLACFGVFLLLYLNLRAVATSLQGDFKVVVYVKDGLPPSGVSELQGLLKADPGVQALVYVSKEQALADFRAQFPDESHLLQGLGENPLPASFIVTLAPSHRSPDSVRRAAERFKSEPGADQVQYSRDWIDNLATVVGYLEDLPALARQAGEGPALLVVGDVVARSDAWLEADRDCAITRELAA